MAKTFQDLTQAQRELLWEAEQVDGDVQTWLLAQSAPDVGKAAVAEVLGGPGAGQEVLP